MITTFRTIALLFCALAAHAFAQEPAPFVATTGVVLDATTMTRLAEKDADLREPPASNTAVMLLYLIGTQTDLDWSTIVSTVHKGQSGETSCGLIVGEVITLRDATYGIGLRSGNDCKRVAADIIGQYLLGAPAGAQAIAATVALMNETAAVLDLTNTHYIDPTGYNNDWANHYMSAADLAKIMKLALDQPFVAQVLATRMYVADNHVWRTASINLCYLPGTVGAKDGYMAAQGASYSLRTRRGAHDVVTATLRNPETVRNRYEEGRDLTGWAYRALGETGVAADATCEEGNAAYVGTWGSAPFNDALYGDGYAKYSQNTGAYLTQWCDCTGFSVLLQTGTNRGKARIDVASLDPVSGAWVYGPATLADSYTPTAQPAHEVWSVDGLPPGPHLLRLTIAGARNSKSTSAIVYYDAVRVRRDAP